MIIVTGTVAYDYIMDFPGAFGDHILPDQIHKINLSFIVNKFARRRGGTAGNMSYSLGLLDTPHTLFAAAGKDFRDYQEVFASMRIDTSAVAVYGDLYTATGFAMTDKNNNQIWGYFYGAAEESKNLTLKKIANTNDLVVIGPAGAVGSMSMVEQCISLGIPYMFDPGFILTQVSDEDLAKGVRHAVYIIGNDYELDLIKNRVKDWKKIFADKTIITTLGEKGAVIEEKGKTYTIKPAKVLQVVDPTGAGDAWRSGFLAGLHRQFDMQTCGQMGSIAAAYAVEQYGTQEHTYTKKEFQNRYRQVYSDMINW